MREKREEKKGVWCFRQVARFTLGCSPVRAERSVQCSGGKKFRSVDPARCRRRCLSSCARTCVQQHCSVCYTLSLFQLQQHVAPSGSIQMTFNQVTTEREGRELRRRAATADQSVTQRQRHGQWPKFNFQFTLVALDLTVLFQVSNLYAKSFPIVSIFWTFF